MLGVLFLLIALLSYVVLLKTLNILFFTWSFILYK